jgi:hypothetical protein
MQFCLTLIWSKGKNVENKNEGAGRGTRVRVRVREVSRSIYFHFQHFYLSTYVPFFFLFDFFTFDQSSVNTQYVIPLSLMFCIYLFILLMYIV